MPETIDALGDIVKTTLVMGHGDSSPTPPVEVLIHLTATHAGKVIESTLEDAHPRAVLLCGEQADRRAGALPRGLELAVCRMRQGERAKIILKGTFAPFGEAGLPACGIGAHAAVEYEVELVSWMVVQDILGDQSVVIKPIVAPEPCGVKPCSYDRIELRYCGRIVPGGGERQECGQEVIFVNEGFGPRWEDGPDTSVVLRRTSVASIEPRGLRTSVECMWKGCSYLVTLAPEQAFGTAEVLPDGSGAGARVVVPASSTVEYKVEIVGHSSVQDLTGDRGVLMETLSSTSGPAAQRPSEGSVCVVSYQSAVQGDGPIAGRQYEAWVQRRVGIGHLESPLTDGLERALQAMTQGQACMVRVEAGYAYGDAGFVGIEAAVAPGQAVEHRVTLLDFEPPGKRGIKGMSFEEQIDFAKKVKDVGNKLFQRGEAVAARRAICRYDAVTKILAVPDHQASAALKAAALEVRAAAFANVAACHMLLSDWKGCHDSASQALQLRRCPKAIYRRALACVELGRLEDAEVDLNALLVGHAGQARDAAVLALKKRIAVLRREADKQSAFKCIFTPD